MTAAGRTTEIRVRGSVESNYRTAYDVLVRPRGTQLPLEREQGLVRNNYLSGLFGGITLKQWREIKEIAGVEVAAPVANIGYVTPRGFADFRPTRLPTAEPVQLYRIRWTMVAHRGTSRYPLKTDYVYYTRQNPFELRYGIGGGIYELLGGREDNAVGVCTRGGDLSAPGPFAAWEFRQCYSARSPGRGSDAGAPGLISVGADIAFPILLAAVDPVEEAKLLELDRAVVAGRYLRPAEKPWLNLVSVAPRTYHRAVPVIAATRTYVDEDVEARVERLAIPPGTDVPRKLASSDGNDFLDALEGTEIERRRMAAGRFYESALRNGAFASEEPKTISNSYWAASPVRYRSFRDRRLEPKPVENPPSVWRADSDPSGAVSYQVIPPANADLQFRRLYPRIGSIYFDRFEVPGGQVGKTPVMWIVGRYDPERLPGFSPLSRVPLETYYPPELKAAGVSSRRALGGKALLPSENIGDYVAQPPLFLTTLEGMRPFLRPKYYAGASEAAPISVIRVRVEGVSGPDELSQARVRAAATEIHERTGLQVDITAGSSPQRLFVELPPGKFGRPRLLLEEGWSKKGVSVSFLQALDKKRLGLLSLILVACAFFLANGTFAAVRGRRTEIGTLLCLGWSSRDVFRVVLAELVLVGLIAGLAASGVATALAHLSSLELPAGRALLIVPLSVALALLAGLVPAWRAARLNPLEAIRPPVWATAGRRRIGRLASLALANLRRMPARSLVGMAGLFVGVASFTLLIAVNQAFQGRLIGTLLGEAISLQVRGLDFLTVALIVALAGFSLADVLYLNLRERAAEIVTLRTVGWSDAHLAFVIAFEALVLGLIAAVAGAVVGVGIGAELGVPLFSLALAAGAGIVGGSIVALLASLLPLGRLAKLTAPAVLADE